LRTSAASSLKKDVPAEYCRTLSKPPSARITIITTAARLRDDGELSEADIKLRDVSFPSFFWKAVAARANMHPT